MLGNSQHRPQRAFGRSSSQTSGAPVNWALDQIHYQTGIPALPAVARSCSGRKPLGSKQSKGGVTQFCSPGTRSGPLIICNRKLLTCSQTSQIRRKGPSSTTILTATRFNIKLGAPGVSTGKACGSEKEHALCAKVAPQKEKRFVWLSGQEMHIFN